MTLSTLLALVTITPVVQNGMLVNKVFKERVYLGEFIEYQISDDYQFIIYGRDGFELLPAITKRQALEELLHQ